MSTGDLIKTLPTDTQPVDRYEQALLDTILKSPDGDDGALSVLANPLLGGALFFFLGLPHVTDFLHTIIPYSATSDMSLLLCKTVLFVAIFFVASNYKK